MRHAALLVLFVLSGCIGYARGDGSGNVEVVTNWGTLGGQPADASSGTPAQDTVRASE